MGKGKVGIEGFVRVLALFAKGLPGQGSQDENGKVPATHARGWALPENPSPVRREKTSAWQVKKH